MRIGGDVGVGGGEGGELKSLELCAFSSSLEESKS